MCFSGLITGARGIISLLPQKLLLSFGHFIKNSDRKSFVGASDKKKMMQHMKHTHQDLKAQFWTESFSGYATAGNKKMVFLQFNNLLQ